MAKNINECKQLLEYRATKAGFNGNLSPKDFNTIFNSAEQRYFNQLYKRYGANQDVDDSIIRFKSDPTPITLVSGRWTKPSTVLHIDALTTTAGYPITRVNDDRLGGYLTSSYDAPTAVTPIYTEYNLFAQIYPINLTTAVAVFLAELIPSVWGYTVVSGRPVYNPATSTQPQWSEADLDEIIYLAGVDLGLNLRDQIEIQVNDVKAKENA